MRSISKAFLVVAVLLGPAIRSHGADLVVASNPVLVPAAYGRQALEFTVANNADQPVTAWEAGVECTYSDDSVRTWWLAREGYEVYVGVSTAEGRVISPHASVTGWILLSARDGLTIVAMRPAVRWAVFADGSWIGDPAGVEDVFRQRQREYRAWSIVVAALRAWQAADSGRQGLIVALEYLNAKGQEDYEHPVKRQMRRNLQLAIDRDASITVAPDEFLRKWLTRAQERLDAAEAHRRAKASGSIK